MVETVQKIKTNPESRDSSNEKLIGFISSIINPLGYELVHIEVLSLRQKILRVFIDHLPKADGSKQAGIGVEDCATVSRALDEPLDQFPEIDAIFKGTYELEVSSPGLDRPLRQEKDFVRFEGCEARIHVYRPLTATELGNATYQSKNPKQKNFVGTLKGLRDGKVLLALSLKRDSGKGNKKKAKALKKAEAETNSVEEVMIPLPLISKANLEPDFEISDERE